MNDKTFSDLIQLNNDFYNSVGESFSRTRKNPWKGWGRVVEKIVDQFKGKDSISILDLGCGNGRFLAFLQDNLDTNFTYTGLDTNEYLLSIAKAKFSEVKGVNFKKHDVILNLDDIGRHCDVIIAFGLTHHIPSSKFRKKWFKSVNSLLTPNGLFIFSIWNYNKDPRFTRKAIREIHTDKYHIRQSDLEKNDYFLGWGETKNVFRYVHMYLESEVTGKKLLKEKLVDIYYVDQSPHLSDRG